MKGQLSGMRGVYLVAAELSRLGFVASPTSRSAAAADILATDQTCERAFSVQVKTNSSSDGFWLVGSKILVSDTHFYVLVNLNAKKSVGVPDFFVVPSKLVKQHTVCEKSANAEFYSLYRRDVLAYKDKWELLGSPSGIPAKP